MARLSSPIENLKTHYPVVVIGSGYGGGIAASRLARSGQLVCVLERGKEFQPGEYPDTEPEVLREFQADLPDKHIGLRTGLLRFSRQRQYQCFCRLRAGGHVAAERKRVLARRTARLRRSTLAAGNPQ